MSDKQASRLIIVFMLVASLIGCNMPAIQNLPALGKIANATNEGGAQNAPIATALPPPAETLISFIVSSPPDTPSDETIYLTLLDEVTGLALNAQPVPMEAIVSTNSPLHSLVTWLLCHLQWDQWLSIDMNVSQDQFEWRNIYLMEVQFVTAWFT